MQHFINKISFLLLLFSIISVKGFTQYEFPVTLPNESQKAMVMQQIGLTNITIQYHSPGVKKREIWGKTIPYNQVWRAGANENTTIEFSDDVQINDQPLPKGIYGLHMIPTEKDWTIIFSKNYTSWGSYFYNEKEDALRIRVTPQAKTHREWLTYEFTEKESQATVVNMHWEKINVSFRIQIDVPPLVVKNLQKELRSAAHWGWTGNYWAADYCFKNNINMAEAMKWIDQSINLDRNFTNLFLKSKMLAKQDKNDEARKIKEEALALGTESEFSSQAYQLAIVEGKKEEALNILQYCVKKHNTWTSHFALARAYQQTGDTKNAKISYQNALKKAPDNQKQRVSKAMESLKL